MSQSEIPIIPDGSPTSAEQTASDTNVDPGPPMKIVTKPGIQKSEGQLTVIFTLLALGLSFLGFKYSPENVANAWQAIQTLIYTIGPLLAAVPILKDYINSRGKITSNSVWANAQLQNPMVSKEGVPPMAAMGLMGWKDDLGKIVSGIGGGTGVKDPATWTGLAKIIGALAGGKTGSIIGKVTGGAGSSSAELDKAFEAIVAILNTHTQVLLDWWNLENPSQKVTTLDELLKKLNVLT